jgi:hypothetical protein
MLPSVEEKINVPPAHAPVVVPGQFKLKLPAGVATLELMLTPEPPNPEPTEFVKLP